MLSPKNNVLFEKHPCNKVTVVKIATLGLSIIFLKGGNYQLMLGGNTYLDNLS